MHDLEYGVPGPGFFRLRIGQWSQAEQVFPPRIALNQPATLELLGTVKPESVSLPPSATIAAIPLPWPGEGLWSGPQPLVEVSSQTQIVEQATGGVQELPAAPLIDISGRLAAARAASP